MACFSRSMQFALLYSYALAEITFGFVSKKYFTQSHFSLHAFVNCENHCSQPFQVLWNKPGFLFVCFCFCFFLKAKNYAVEHAKMPYVLQATNAQMDSGVHSRQCSMYMTVEPACNTFYNKAVKNQTAVSSASLVPL